MPYQPELYGQAGHYEQVQTSGGSGNQSHVGQTASPNVQSPSDGSQAATAWTQAQYQLPFYDARSVDSRNNVDINGAFQSQQHHYQTQHQYRVPQTYYQHLHHQQHHQQQHHHPVQTPTSPNRHLGTNAVQAPFGRSPFAPSIGLSGLPAQNQVFNLHQPAASSPLQGYHSPQTLQTSHSMNPFQHSSPQNPLHYDAKYLATSPIGHVPTYSSQHVQHPDPANLLNFGQVQSTAHATAYSPPILGRNDPSPHSHDSISSSYHDTIQHWPHPQAPRQPSSLDRIRGQYHHQRPSYPEGPAKLASVAPQILAAAPILDPSTTQPSIPQGIAVVPVSKSPQIQVKSAESFASPTPKSSVRSDSSVTLPGSTLDTDSNHVRRTKPVITPVKNGSGRIETPSSAMSVSSQPPLVYVVPGLQDENARPGTQGKDELQSPQSSSLSSSQIRVLAQVQIPRFSGTQEYKTTQSQTDHAKKQQARLEVGRATSLTPASATKAIQSKAWQSAGVPVSSPLSAAQTLPADPGRTVDNQAVLLHIADECALAARNMSSAVVYSSLTDEQLDTYQSLMATAMGCLESVLQNFRISDPRKEARLRLRLAALMLDETENHQEAGDILDKGIALCDRSKLVNLKYAMHHLNVRILHERNPSAASRTLDKLIHEADILKLTAWVFAFRLLRVSFGMRSTTSIDSLGISRQLQAIAQKADHERRTSVLIVASLLEAVVHLRSGALDAVELAQRSLATARTHQLSPDMTRMTQIPTLMDCLDLACHTVHFHPEQVLSRLQQLHQKMDETSDHAGWTNDGSILIALDMEHDKDIDLDTAGIMTSLEHGGLALKLSWLTRNQAYILSYLLSGLVYGHKGNGDGRAESYLTEGLKLCETRLADFSQSLCSVRDMYDWQMSQRLASRLQLIFEYCGRADWEAASTSIDEISKMMPLSVDLRAGDSIPLLMYLRAICKQGRGELEAAYDIYKRPELTFDPVVKEVSAERDVRVLATLNSILILRCINQHDQILADMLLSSVEEYCLSHYNKAIHAAFYIIRATSQERGGMILKTKQYLQSAVQAARASGSNQLLCVVMSLMSSLYFTNIVGDQAEKSMGASRSLAKKSHSNLWLAVTDGMLADTFELVGKRDGAAVARQEAAEAMAKIPQLVKDRIKTMYDDL